MVEDNPIMCELEDMVRFINNNKRNYIFYIDDRHEKIAKYFRMAEISIDGFVVGERSGIPSNSAGLPFFTLGQLEQMIDKQEMGIILAADENVQREVMCALEDMEIKNIYTLSPWNTRTIPYKMTPRSKDDFWLEVNLSDHCNLNCQCCDHFSPLAPKTFLDFDQYERDIKRLAELSGGHIGIMKLQGGEPLLNDRLIDYIKITREYFPETLICIFTDGLLLKKWGMKDGDENIWKAVKDYEIEIRLTEYPINLDKEGIKKQCAEFGVPFVTEPPEFKKGARCWCFSEIGALKYRGIKKSVKHPFDLSGSVEKYRWISCYQFNESIVLRDGKIYTCPMIPYVHYFNDYFKQDIPVTDEDYIDIYKADSFEEIAEFCTHRVPFCDYCAVHKRYSRDWKQSTHEMKEWVLLDKADSTYAADDLLDELGKSGKSIYIYAAGHDGMQIYSKLRDNGIEVEAFIDKNYDEIKRRCSKDVISPEEFFAMYAGKKNKIGIVIGSKAYEDEIYDILIANGVDAEDVYCGFFNEKRIEDNCND